MRGLQNQVRQSGAIWISGLAPTNPGRAVIRYTFSVLDESPIPRIDAKEMALEGSVLSTVCVSGRIFTEPRLTISDATPPSTQIEVEILFYASPEDQWVRRIPVRHRGTLDGLRLVSNSLARRYSWKEAQATNFVLTGISPSLSSSRGGIRMVLSQLISSRITMEIDPTLTPGEVAQRYKDLRAPLAGARFRSMSEKRLRLAKFHGGHKPEGTTWTTLMTRWNHGEGRDWRYDRFEAFVRDCKQAWERLMGRDLLKYPDL